MQAHAVSTRKKPVNTSRSRQRQPSRSTYTTPTRETQLYATRPGYEMKSTMPTNSSKGGYPASVYVSNTIQTYEDSRVNRDLDNVSYLN